MPELFISYSRRDKAGFVERFIKALNENGYLPEQIWVDWEDIPASVDWEAEIHKGIEEADSVIFVLTPHWATSNECAKELTYALQFNKRLFPIIYQDVDPKTLPKELASLNWIYFRDTDDFGASLKTLLAALKTDVAYTKMHTQLVTRAKVWDSNQRDSARLLRGSELQEAETWLSQASDDKQPRPTALQREFIFESSAAAQRAQRRQLFAVTGALVISIALAIAAAFSAVEALVQGQKAQASQLAAQSSNLIGSQPDLALLLSLEANYIGDELGEKDAAWLGSLITSLNSSPHLFTYLRDNKSAIRAVAFSPDGKWLAAAGQAFREGDPIQVTLWDRESMQVYDLTGHTKRVLSLVFSRDGQYLIGAGEDGMLFVWDPTKCCAPVNAWPIGKSTRALALVKMNGRELVTGAVGNEIYFWDIATGEVDPAMRLALQAEDPLTRIQSLAVSPDNTTLAVGSNDGNITVWDLSTRAFKYPPLCNFGDPGLNERDDCHISKPGLTEVRGIAFSPDGTWLAAGSSDQRVWLWNVATGEMVTRSPDGQGGGHINTVTSVLFNAAGDQLVTASWDNTVRVWNIKEDTGWRLQLDDILNGHASSIWALAFSPDGHWLASGSSDQTTILWKIDQLSQLGHQVDKMDGAVWALATPPQRDQLAAADEAGHIRIWAFDGQTLSNPRTLKQTGAIYALAYSHDGRWLASVGADLNIHVWDVAAGQEVWTIPAAHTDEIWSVLFSPDDRWLASASFDGTVKLWDVATHQVLSTPEFAGTPQGYYTLAFKQDGSQLIAAGYNRDIQRIDLSETGAVESITPLKGHDDAVNSLSFNPDYPNILASTSDDKTLLIWDVETGTPSDPVLGLNESMEAVTFRPDGGWLASATNNDTVLLWQWDAQRCDAGACQPVILGAPMIGHQEAVANVLFLSETRLVSSSVDGQLILWDLNESDWHDQACALVNRSLSEGERAQYINNKVEEGWLKIFAWKNQLFGAEAIAPPSCLSDVQP